MAPRRSWRRDKGGGDVSRCCTTGAKGFAGPEGRKSVGPRCLVVVKDWGAGDTGGGLSGASGAGGGSVRSAN